jgi:hypothetical protein
VVGSNVTRHLITGLTPGAGYNVTMTASGGQTTVTLTTGSTYVADVGGVIGIGFPASPTPTQGGYAPGFKGLNPGTPVQSGGGGSSGGGGTTTATCGTVVKNGSTYTGPCAPLALIADGVYFYDTGNQRSYQQTNGQWIIFNDGKTLTYSQTATGWQGPGAPEQPIANGAMYYDSVEKRNYQQVGNTWVLLLPARRAPAAALVRQRQLRPPHRVAAQSRRLVQTTSATARRSP